MSAPSLAPSRCEPRDLLRLLAPGQVVGLFEGNQWIDWGGPCGPDLEILTPGRTAMLNRVNRRGFHLVVDTNGNPRALGGLVDCLAGTSRGVAVVSARLGALLRWASRIATVPAGPPRASGPFRPRTSGAVFGFRETTLRIVESAQVQDSAMLSVGLPDPARAVGVLGGFFPDLQVDRATLHLQLRGYHAEEVLGRLREEGIPVTASVVWYRLLQNCPRLSTGPLTH